MKPESPLVALQWHGYCAPLSRPELCGFLCRSGLDICSETVDDVGYRHESFITGPGRTCLSSLQDAQLLLTGADKREREVRGIPVHYQEGPPILCAAAGTPRCRKEIDGTVRGPGPAL